MYIHIHVHIHVYNYVTMFSINFIIITHKHKLKNNLFKKNWFNKKAICNVHAPTCTHTCIGSVRFA